MEFPGLTSINFEILFDILCEEVIGWSRRRKCATDEPGLFGKCLAMSGAFEEQGRKTVHGHMTLHIEGYREMQKNLFFGEKDAKRRADKVLSRYHETLTSNKLFPTCTRDLRDMFDHDCIRQKNDQDLPEVVPEQVLRELRHKEGYNHHGGRLVYCPHCGKEWTYEDMIRDFLRKNEGIECKLTGMETMTEQEILDALNELPRARLQHRVIQFQKNFGAGEDETPSTCINALYQHHVSCHVRGCFRCSKLSKKAHICGPTCECRFRMPDCLRSKTTIHTLHDDKKWYSWDGTWKLQPMIEFQGKRNRYDLFQNTSCEAISESKFSCNSNLALITDGPVGFYQYKYVFKNTQKDDTAHYEEVDRTIKLMDGHVKYPDDDKREAMRRITRAAFAHNSTNVIGAPLAAFLNRTGSRFYFSHDFTYCPLYDIMKLHRKEKVPVNMKYSQSGDVFFENQALHYLCRHEDLEDVSAKDFYEQYTVIPMGNAPLPGNKRKRKNKKSSRDEGKWSFKAQTVSFTHPSVKRDKQGNIGGATQGVKLREKPGLIRVPQWGFIDTAKFKGSHILKCPTEEIIPAMDEYAFMMLCLFYPHRNIEDLSAENPRTAFKHVEKLREVAAEDHYRSNHQMDPIVFNLKNLTFLQNLQDAAFNSPRYKAGKDDLSRRTEAFHPGDDEALPDGEQVDDEEDDENQFAIDLEALFEAMDDDNDTSIQDEDETYLEEQLNGFSLDSVRSKGTKQCGLNPKLPVPDRAEDIIAQETTFVTHEGNPNLRDAVAPNRSKVKPPFPKLERLVELLLTKGTCRRRAQVFKYNEDVEVIDATGSVESILHWAQGAKLDALQERAFVAIVASFLLTFYDDAGTEALNDAAMDSANKRTFRDGEHDKT